MPILVEYKRGLKICRTTDNLIFLADPISAKGARGSQSVFITHAHTDHSMAFPNSGTKIYSSKLTNDIYHALTGKISKNVQFLDINKTEKIKGVDVQLLPAGHLLGASQTLFYFDEKTILYTGDISTDKMITVPQATVPEGDIDTLIIESTYGTPNIFFEPRSTIKFSLLKWIMDNLQKKRVPVINIGYSGPAQEIIAFLNEMLSVDIYCNARVSKVNEIYKRESVSINWYDYDQLGEEPFRPENSIVLLPRSAKKPPSFLEEHRIARGILTGQAARFAYSNFQQSFPFSMHANFGELLEFVEKVNPKTVYTIYGYDSELAAVIRNKLKIPSRPLKAIGKTTLEEFF